MADYSETNVSVPNKKVTQYLFWNTEIKRIEVSHSINLDPSEDVFRKSIKEYKPGDTGYTDLEKKYNPKTEGVKITVFTYQLKGEGMEEMHNEVFPENGPYYLLEGLSHLVVVELLNEQGGETSSASGEALGA
jgi:hypothetical protein